VTASGFTMRDLDVSGLRRIVPDYQAEARTFAARAERTLYFPGVLTNQTIDYTRPAGQYVRTAFRTSTDPRCCRHTGRHRSGRVLQHSAAPACDIIADAQRTLVIRDGVASFFYNPEDPLSYLQQTVQGLLDLGYQFVSPLDV